MLHLKFKSQEKKQLNPQKIIEKLGFLSSPWGFGLGVGLSGPKPTLNCLPAGLASDDCVSDHNPSRSFYLFSS